jgi:signal transduction histidine kinase
MNSGTLPAKKTDILIVDDTPANLDLLSNMLISQGFQVGAAINGTIALMSAQTTPPDLILLDIKMPDLNGYEVCQRLKANKKTRDIPVIFISALDEVLDKVKAFEVGGVDYITKPFQVEEVLARINTHLTIRNLQMGLQAQNAELDAFAHTVAHDLKNPLGLVIGYNDYLIEAFSEMKPEEALELLQNVKKTGQKMSSIIDELLLLAGVRKEQATITSLNMANIVAQAQQRLVFMIEEYQGEIIVPDDWPVAQGYAPWIEEVWANYISNGLKYGGRPPRLELGATLQDTGMIRFWVRDNGSGLDPAAQAQLFTTFTRLDETRAQGHGLGLSIVRRIVEKLGGQVSVESEGVPDQGSVFSFTLPSAAN